MKTKITAKLFAGVLAACTLTLGANAAFAKTNTYTDGQFKDVKTTSWYAKEVASAYELGFMNGTSTDVFSPDGNVTVAQGITMAVRVHANFNGKEAPSNSTSGNWYDSFVKYAVDNGIIKADDFDSYTRNITRAEMAVLFADAVPASEFKAINGVEHIPDVIESNDYASKILMLYNAGVVMGSDAYGTFNPDADIKRSEAAAIINRVAIPENRLEKALKEYTARDAYQFVYSDGSYDNSILAAQKTSVRDNIASGWVLDNRGGTARTSIEQVVTGIEDVSETQGTALIREFNKISEDKVVAEFSALVKGNGAYIEYRDDKGNPAYSIKIVDDSWAILGKDGKYTTLVKASQEKNEKFRIYLDFTMGKSKTYIDNVYYGEHSLLSDNIVNFRFAIDEKGTGGIFPKKVNMVANYGVFEIFDTFALEEAYGWKVEGNAAITLGELVLTDKASVIKPFDAIDTKYVAEMLAIFPEGETASFKVMSGSASAIELKSKDGKLLANGKAVYDLTKNMWYRLRVEANPSTAKAEIIVNGRTVGEVSLSTTNPVDTLAISSENGNARFDNIKVYNLADHYDYVPEPSAKADLSDYIVAMNVCSLWRNNGIHWGWACITPYDENKPVLGYYDEGNPESADWEIKFMAEHGIDVQALCWYADVKIGPLKTPHNSYQLHDGYQQAKYEDYMKYCLIWEAAGGAWFKADQFRNHVVPYWFENYFLDENYLVVDNKPVLHIYGLGTLTGSSMFGSVEQAKAELDYLEDVAKGHGFDGMLYISNGAITTLEELGIDASAAYHWDAAGYTYQTNVDRNTSNALVSDKVYQIPTISVGYSDYAWRGAKAPLMSIYDYEKSHEWVKSTYIPTYAEKGTWQEKMVWLSTWNEYGEGTYIMPSEALRGFGYVDVIRDKYTNLGADHEDVVPTDAQSERITHLYPQYARLLRRQGYYGMDMSIFEPKEEEDDDTPVEYETQNVVMFEQGAIGTTGIEDITYSDGVISGVTNNNNPQVYPDNSIGTELDNAKKIKFNIKLPAGKVATVYYATSAAPSLSESQTIRITSTSNEMTAYEYDTSALQGWKGTLTKLRIDPSDDAGVSFSLGAIEFIGIKGAGTSTEYEVESSVTFENGTVSVVGVENTSFENGAVTGTSSIHDFSLYPTIEPVKLDIVDKLVVNLKIPAGKQTTIYYTTEESPSMGEDKTLRFTSTSSDMKAYEIDVSALPLWTGTLKKLRIDPTDGEGVEFTLGSIDFLKVKGTQAAEENYEVLQTVTFADAKALNLVGITNVSYEGGMLSGTSEKDDFSAYVSNIEEIDLDKVDKIRVKTKLPRGKRMTIYYTTSVDGSLSESKTVRFNSTSDDMREYIVDVNKMDKAELFTGTLKGLRVDPTDGEGISFSLVSIEFLETVVSEEEATVENSELYINNQKLESVIKPEKNGDEILFPFDPETAVHYIMYAFMTWNHDAKELTLEANNHKVVYMLGKDTFTVDGVSKPLGYTLYATDGLPMLSYKTLAQAFGFTYKSEGGKVYIETPEIARFEEKKTQSDGTYWEFNTFETEGWGSNNSELTANGEYMNIDNTTKDHSDPSMSISGLKVSTSSFKTMEVRMKYDYEHTGISSLAIYFITDVDKSWNEKKVAYVKHEAMSTDGDWVVFTVDMSALETWTGNVTSVRIDPFNGVGTADVDYIRFVK